MKAPRICIVEDDPIIAADLAERLHELGYATAGPYASGEAAYADMQGDWPDLFILDIQLEGAWDGIDLARRIRQTQDLPIIFLSSNTDDHTFGKAKMIGPQAFLSKPFRGNDLKHAIELAIRQAARPPQAAGEDSHFLFKDRLFIKDKERMLRLLFDDILWAEAHDYYCKIVTKDKELLLTKTLKRFGEDLAKRPEFMRVHRSYIVNLSQVEIIEGPYLYMGQKRVPFSKSFKEALMARLKHK